MSGSNDILAEGGKLQNEAAVVTTLFIYDLVASAFSAEKRLGLRERITEIVLAGIQAYAQQALRERLRARTSDN